MIQRQSFNSVCLIGSRYSTEVIKLTILEFMRNKAFWLLDYMRGGVIRKELKLLQDVNSMLPTSLEKYRKQAIEELLDYAAEKTKFYARYKGLAFTDWPVISKRELKAATDDFLSSDFQKSDLIPMSTSGSTGTPLTVFHDRNKKKSVYAEVLYYNGKVGYQIGTKIIYLRSIVSEVSKSPLQQFTQNISLVDCNDLSNKGIEEKLALIATLTKHSKAVMMGYASTLDAFRDYFNRNGIAAAENCRLSGIISGSEMLFDETREVIEKAFHCICISRYANEEQGFLGQDGFKNNLFRTNCAHYYFEVLDFDRDEPVVEGNVGRLVVTDLKNYSMPLIRYDTGDIGRLITVNENGAEWQAIDEFGGRKVDMIFNASGDRISPHSITNAMWEFTDINQYQLIQNGPRTYTLKINTSPHFQREEDLERIVLGILGSPAQLRIEHVSEIPVLNSGKRKYIVNEM